MMNRIIVLASCLILGGCGLSQQIAAEQAALDDAKCRGYGSRAGEPAYVQCRSQLEAARTQARATLDASIGNSSNAVPGPIVAQPMSSYGLHR